MVKNLWKEIKNGLKIGVATVLFSPILWNTGGYISTNRSIHDIQNSRVKEIIMENVKGVYQEGDLFQKIYGFGDYLAANKYLQNKK